MFVQASEKTEAMEKIRQTKLQNEKTHSGQLNEILDQWDDHFDMDMVITYQKIQEQENEEHSEKVLVLDDDEEEEVQIPVRLDDHVIEMDQKAEQAKNRFQKNREKLDQYAQGEYGPVVIGQKDDNAFGIEGSAQANVQKLNQDGVILGQEKAVDDKNKITEKKPKKAKSGNNPVPLNNKFDCDELFFCKRFDMMQDLLLNNDINQNQEEKPSAEQQASRIEALKDKQAEKKNSTPPDLKAFGYEIDARSIMITDNGSTLQMTLVSTAQSLIYAEKLTLKIGFFQGGILHFWILEEDKEEDAMPRRFRSSQHDGVEWDQLRPEFDLQSKLTHNVDEKKITVNTFSLDGSEKFVTEILLDKFRVNLYSNSRLMLVINPFDSLLVENTEFFYSEINDLGEGNRSKDQENHYQQLQEKFQKLNKQSENPVHQAAKYLNSQYRQWKANQTGEEPMQIKAPFDRAQFTYKAYKSKELNKIDFHESIGMGFFMPNTFHMYGIPERAYSHKLTTTDEHGPYRLFNIDLFPHSANSTVGLYASVPYLTGHGNKRDASILWCNSGDTFVHILNKTVQNKDHGQNQSQKGTYSSFVSAGGSLEFFAFASTKGMQAMQTNLNQITGYPSMPPAFALGFHFSKWNKPDLTAEKMVERMNKFAENRFQVDVLWMDIDYALEKQYFVFNPNNFAEKGLMEMNVLAEKQKRRFVVITDPHISTRDKNHVFKQGKELESYTQYQTIKQYQLKDDLITDVTEKTQKDKQDGEFTSIWVKDSQATVFKGSCWPGTSAYVDFLNPQAQEFWSYQMQNFNGTNHRYHFWIDMNEPSVFNQPNNTMPQTNLHYDKYGRPWLHKDVHNLYGALQNKATMKGLLQRDGVKDQQGNLIEQAATQRPFFLTRSFFAGNQKYSAYWTGDNYVGFQDLKSTVQQILTNGICGVIFGGADVPSFAGENSDNVFVLSYQLGALMPFFRAHSTQDQQKREPWLKNYSVQKEIHKALDLRYQLFHYLYTEFYLSSQNGSPIWKPMWVEYPEIEHQDLWDVDEQFMLGSNILVAPKILQKFVKSGQSIRTEVKEFENPLDETSKEVKYNITYKNEGNSTAYFVNVHIPEPMFEWDTGIVVQGKDLAYMMPLEQIPMFVKYGSILPIFNVHSDNRCLSIEDCWHTTLNLTIWGGYKHKISSADYPDGVMAEGMLYWDDGISLPVKGSLYSFSLETDGSLWVTCLQDSYHGRSIVISALKVIDQGIELKDFEHLNGKHQIIGPRGPKTKIDEQVGEILDKDYVGPVPDSEIAKFAVTIVTDIRIESMKMFESRKIFQLGK